MLKNNKIAVFGGDETVFIDPNNTRERIDKKTNSAIKYYDKTEKEHARVLKKIKKRQGL